MPLSASQSTECICDDVLFALALGQLEAPDLARAESHLSRCSECRTVLAEVARSLDAAASSPSRAHAFPMCIARYEVLDVLGTGASGVVYRAFDPNLRRTVALKLLRSAPDGASSSRHERMLREAQAMAQLSHANVVLVFDVGVHEGSVYIVMEYVDGLTLSEWLKLEPRPPQELLRVFRQAGQGLHSAHEKGLVHRDFKPANVLVSSEGIAKVTDFGLARMETSSSFSAVSDDGLTDALTQTRGLVGTPAYMAPELFEGGAANAASDQYAFCVALYTALVGRHPFRAGEGIALSELVMRAKSGVIETPPLARRVSPRVIKALHRGLSVAPAARFSNMRSLLVGLEPPPSSRRIVSVALAFVMLLVLGAFVAHRSRSMNAAGHRSNAPKAVTLTKAAEPKPTLPDATTSPEMRAFREAPALNTKRPAASSAPRRSRKAAPKEHEQRRDVRYNDWLKDPF